MFNSTWLIWALWLILSPQWWKWPLLGLGSQQWMTDDWQRRVALESCFDVWMMADSKDEMTALLMEFLRQPEHIGADLCYQSGVIRINQSCVWCQNKDTKGLKIRLLFRTAWVDKYNSSSNGAWFIHYKVMLRWSESIIHFNKSSIKETKDICW